MEYVLVTGVSSGIGYSVVAELLKAGFYVFGSVRNDRDAERLKSVYASNFTAIIMDVTDDLSISAAAKEVKRIIGDKFLKAIINNAGIAVCGAWTEIESQQLLKQFEVNVFGPAKIIKMFFPMLYKNDQVKSQIINISSVSGKISSPFVGAYASSKHALESLSDSLRRELMRYAIDVVVIEPGNVATPIWSKAPSLEKYESSDYYKPVKELFRQVELVKKIKPEKIAQCVLNILKTHNPKARYAVPDRWITGWILPRILPDKILDKVFDKVLRISDR